MVTFSARDACPKSLDMPFPRAYFDSVRAAPPSPTIMPRFNEKVARLRKRGLAPEWMPNQKFSPADVPHLLIALALSQGAWGGLDLADVMSDMPKLLTKLRDAVFATDGVGPWGRTEIRPLI